MHRRHHIASCHRRRLQRLLKVRDEMDVALLRRGSMLVLGLDEAKV